MAGIFRRLLLIVGQSMYDCPLWVERKPWVNWVEPSLIDGIFRSSERRKWEARELTAVPMKGSVLGSRKFQELRHYETQNPNSSKVAGKVQWTRVGDKNKSLMRDKDPALNHVDQSTSNRFEALSSQCIMDTVFSVSGQKDNIEEDHNEEDLNKDAAVIFKDLVVHSGSQNLMFGKKYLSKKHLRKSQLMSDCRFSSHLANCPSKSSMEEDVFGDSHFNSSFDSESKAPFENLKDNLDLQTASLNDQLSQSRDKEEVLECLPLASIGPEIDWQGTDEILLLGDCGNDQKKISAWVVNRMRSLKKILGISSEGFEDKIMDLLRSIERRREENKNGDGIK